MLRRLRLPFRWLGHNHRPYELRPARVEQGRGESGDIGRVRRRQEGLRRPDIRIRLLRLRRSSIPTGSGHRFSSAFSFSGQIVTAPRAADETWLAYLAITPVEYRGCGGRHDARRCFISESGTSTRSSRLGKSKTIRSPSRRPAIGPPAMASEI